KTLDPVVHAARPRKVKHAQLTWDPRPIRLPVILLRPVWFDPVRMRLHTPPLVFLQERLCPAKLTRPRQLVCGLPARITPATSMRRRAKGLVRRVHLPDAVGTVGMACGSAQYARPKHEPLHF